MKKYILKILIFFAIVGAIDYGIGKAGDFLYANTKRGEAKRINDLLFKDSYDILIFGSSRAHHHYDTPFLSDTLGMDVYNSGVDGNGIILSEGLFEILLERYKPRLIIYDVEPKFDINFNVEDDNNIRYISTLKPFYRNKSVSDIIKDVSTEEWCKTRSGMIRYNSGIPKLVANYLGSVGNVDTSLRGFDPLYGDYDGRKIEDESSFRKRDTLKLKYLRKIIDVAQRRNIPIMMIASPKYRQPQSDILQPAIDICEEKGVLFLNYYSDVEYYDNNLFNDSGHLNTKGARLFSSQIVPEIKSILNI